MRLHRAIALLVAAAGLVLQIYLRTYPYVRSGCRWPGSARHRLLAFGDPQITGNVEQQRLRKRVDIAGNDRFLQQIAATTRRVLRPQYAAVMGDLLSSQWIDTPEFERRAQRFARIFPLAGPGELLNVSGNHDIGYHGEFSAERLQRFERRFGQLNFVVQADGFRIVVVNSLSLDGPPFDAAHAESWRFVAALANCTQPTVLLTHVPLYKPAGLCRDGPGVSHGADGGIVAQNHLSFNTTQQLLNSALPAGGIVLAGHDHEGCVVRYRRSAGGNNVWEPAAASDHHHQQQDRQQEDADEVLEVTVRSMMGEFGGNAALLSSSDGRVWHYSLCAFHVQHVWWVAQVLTLLGALLVPVSFMV